MSAARDFLALTKPGLVMMVIVTTFAGFYLAGPGVMETVRLAHTLIGTSLVAAGALALNQYFERDVDARMARTRLRPLPGGRLRPSAALSFGAGLCASGLSYLAGMASPLSSAIAATVVASYLFLYTPLKKRSALCTVVGAFPGALPPLIGWAGARDGLGLGAWILAAILFFWQFPHSLAIARLYRDDYEAGGVRLLPVVDPNGKSTDRQIVLHTLALLVVGMMPPLIRMAGAVYFFFAFFLGGLMLAAALNLARSPSASAARGLMFASHVYLPAVLLLMCLDARGAP